MPIESTVYYDPDNNHKMLFAQNKFLLLDLTEKGLEYINSFDEFASLFPKPYTEMHFPSL